MTLRTLFYLLLAANLVCGVLLFGPAVGFNVLGDRNGEPERVTNQLHPEQIRVIGEEVPNAPNAPSAPALREAPSAAPAPVEQSEPVAAISNAPTCVAYRGFSAQQGQLILTSARANGDALTIRETDVPTPTFWVNIPARGGKEEADRRANDLQQMGIEDFFVVQEEGPAQYAISLGLFKSEPSARRHLEALQKKGLQTARITTRESTTQTGRIELQGPGDLLERLHQELGARLQGVERAACPA